MCPCSSTPILSTDNTEPAMIPLFSKLIARFRKVHDVKMVTNDDDDGIPTDRPRVFDPLDPFARANGDGWDHTARPDPVQLTVADYPIYEASDEGQLVLLNKTSFAADAAIAKSVATMDDGQGAPAFSAGTQTVSGQLTDWYMSQGFIGYQACATIAQHWLVDKACSMAGEDSIRNGWTIKAADDDNELSKSDHDALVGDDVGFKLKENLAEYNRFKNIFGIRVALFEIESDDVKYYEKPFNIDGITEGSYKGISQVDPYWMTPMLTTESTSNPASMHFYEPEYWIISGKKFHRSHLIISRGPQPADILKPTYVFGGVPLTQRIYERVYAAERTANEAPLLAMNKRTTALHVDLEKVAANEGKFLKRLVQWVRYRDNHAVKVLGKEETMEQFDTSLADFDAVIMNQYQLVSAISKVPSTKLLGTSPKGFNATGEFETVSYHEELESTQEHVMAPLLERHYLLLAKSKGINVDLQVVFDPVDSVTAAGRADLNEKKASTGEKLINIGAISADEERQRLRDDKHSGYNRLTDVDGNETPGMSPENIAALEKGLGTEQSGQGEMERGQAALAKPAAPAGGAKPPVKAPVIAKPDTQEGDQEPVEGTTAQTSAAAAPSTYLTSENVTQLLNLLTKMHETMMPEGGDVPDGEGGDRVRTTKPGTGASVKPNVAGIRSVTPEVEEYKLPKIKVAGLIAAIENPRGTIRKGMGLNGKQWAAKMPHHYGYIKGTKGADGDEVDCFIGQNMQAPMVYVMNQKDPSTGGFDEHKCMIGFNSMEEAKNAYLAAYSSGWNGAGDMVEMGMDQFKEWLNTGDCTQPLSANNLAQAGSAPETA